MDAMNQFEGTAVVMVLFVIRLGIPILGLYGLSRFNQRIYAWLNCPDCEAKADLVAT